MKVLENFESYNTGQTLMAFETPVEIVNRLNEVYDEDGPTNLINEKTINRLREDIKIIFLDDEEDNCNFIPDYIHEWIKDRIHQYLNFIGEENFKGIKPTRAWINDMEAKDYNWLHRHTRTDGRLGLSVLIGLKIPADMERPASSKRANNFPDGQTEFIGAGSGQQFVSTSILIKFKERLCIVFPYDVLHQVYPHFSNQTRRTMSMNVDVFF